MESTVRFLAEKSLEHILLDFDRFFFRFQSFYILIIFGSEDRGRELNEEFYEHELRESELKDLPRNYFHSLYIDSFVITDYEYLGDRGYYTKNDLPKSIAYKMFSLVKAIYTLNNNAISNYNLDLNDGYDDSGEMCPSEPKYIFNVFLKPDFFLDKTFLDNLLDIYINETFIPQFYLNDFQNYEQQQLIDDKKVLILSTNTKARRLGYLKLLTKMFYENPQVPVSKLNSRFEDYVAPYNHQLKDNIDNKGLIKKTKSGISAKPYIEVANQLDLLGSISNTCFASKPMKVYQVLSDRYRSNDENPFHLNSLDKIFFLDLLLRKDYLYIFSLLEMLFLNNSITYDVLLEKFKNHLLLRLDNFINEVKYERNNKLSLDIKSVRQRISSWEKEDVYLEHVLMPRLNWLLDLAIIDKIEKDYFLSSYGEELFKHLCFFSDINYGWLINATNFLDKFLIFTYSNVFEDASKPSHTFISKEILYELIDNYIDESFNQFKTLAPNRVTSSQAILYTKISMYLDKKIPLSSNYIEHYLLTEASNKYVYKFQKQYKDGYIQKILLS